MLPPMRQTRRTAVVGAAAAALPAAATRQVHLLQSAEALQDKRLDPR